MANKNVTATPKKETKKQSKSQSSLSAQFNNSYRSLVTDDNGEFRIGYKELRNLAVANPFVAVAINKIKQKVVKAEYVIKAKDPKDGVNYKVEIDYIKALLKNPNQQDDTYRTLISKVMDDVLTLDIGVIEEVRNGRGEIMELYYVDGATIRERRDQYGYFESPAYVQFLPRNAGTVPDASFEANELMILQANPKKDLRGFSPVEMVISSVVAGIRAAIYNNSQLSDQKLPPSIINLKGVGTEEIVQFKQAFEAQLAGKPWSNAYTNAEDLDVTLLRPSNQEMQFFELNLWLARIVISAF
jgi:phage portal protein BeeE